MIHYIKEFEKKTKMCKRLSFKSRRKIFEEKVGKLVFIKGITTKNKTKQCKQV